MVPPARCSRAAVPLPRRHGRAVAAAVRYCHVARAVGVRCRDPEEEAALCACEERIR